MKYTIKRNSIIFIIILGISGFTFMKIKKNDYNKYDLKINEKNSEKKPYNKEIYEIFPNIENVKNLKLKKFLETLPHKEYIDKSNFPDWRSTKNIPSNILNKLVCQNLNNIFNSNIIFLDCTHQIDGRQLTWKATTLLPTNGNFIMLMLSFLYVDIDENEGAKHVIITLDLSGNFLSGYCIFEYTEYGSIKNGDDSLCVTDGWANYLNTNQPVVRIALSWDNTYNYSKHKEKYSCINQITQFEYLIDSNGTIKIKQKKDILPIKHFIWFGNEIPYDLTSDTIQKLLKIN